MEEGFKREEVHISDTLHVLYRRRYVAILAFLVVFASVTIHTLTATPIYEAFSTIRIKDRSKKSLLSELIQLDSAGTVAAEVEIIKSRSVAEEVVRLLDLDTVLIGFPSGAGLTFDNLRVSKALKGKVFTVTFLSDEGEYAVSYKGGKPGKGRLGVPFQWKEGEGRKEKDLRFLLDGSGAVEGVWFEFLQPPFRVAVRRVMNATEVRPVGDMKTQILRVYYRAPLPHRARRIVNAIVETYRKRNISENAREARETLHFIEKQRALVQEDLAESEEALRDYKAAEGVMSLSEETGVIIQGYAQFAVDGNRIAIEIRHNEAILQSLDQAGSSGFGLPSMSKENTVLSNMGLQLSELEAGRGELLAILTTSHPEVVAIQARIDELKTKIRQVVKNTLKTLAARRGRLEEVLAEYQERLKSLPAQERELAELIRARKVNSEIYAFLSQKREEARISEAATIGNVSVIDSAEAPLGPISPNLRLNLILGLVAGLLLAVGVAFFLEFIDDSLKSTAEVERYIKKPIYGIVPRIPSQPRGEEKELPAEAYSLVTRHSPKSPISESFRTLRTNIHFSDPDHPATELLITSAGPSEGKSTIVTNLALTIANTGKKTLLIDCDLRKPKVHNFFNLPRDPGITNLLSGDGEWRRVIRATEVENLHVLSSGPIPPNPAEVLGSQSMRDILAKFREEFDMILLDSPPVVAVTDAAILSSFIQATLLVVELGRSRVSTVNRAIDLLEKVNARLLGIVTNNISAGFRYDYAYDYYYEIKEGKKKGRKKRRRRYGR